VRVVLAPVYEDLPAAVLAMLETIRWDTPLEPLGRGPGERLVPRSDIRVDRSTRARPCCRSLAKLFTGSGAPRAGARGQAVEHVPAAGSRSKAT